MNISLYFHINEIKNNKSITENIIFSVKTDLLTRGAISRLSIAFATNKDSGNYTCSMRSAQASVIVHILNGK